MAKVRLLFSLLALGASAFASSFTFYTSESAFQSAIVGIPQQTITFDNLSTGFYDPLISDGVTFVGDVPNVISNSGVRIADQASWTQAFFASNTGNSLASGGMLNITLPSGTYAVGFLVGSSFVVVTQSSTNETLTVGTSSTMVPVTPSNPFAFVGVLSDSPFSTIRISGGGSLLTIDNFAFATSSTPEPSSAMLIAIPLAALAYSFRVQSRD